MSSSSTPPPPPSPPTDNSTIKIGDHLGLFTPYGHRKEGGNYHEYEVLYVEEQNGRYYVELIQLN